MAGCRLAEARTARRPRIPSKPLSTQYFTTASRPICKPGVGGIELRTSSRTMAASRSMSVATQASVKRRTNARVSASSCPPIQSCRSPGRAAATAPRRPSQAPADASRAGRGRRWWRSDTARPGTSTVPRRSPVAARHGETSPAQHPRRPRTTRASGSSARAAPGGDVPPAPRTPAPRPRPDRSRSDRSCQAPPAAYPSSSRHPSASSWPVVCMTGPGVTTHHRLDRITGNT